MTKMKTTARPPAVGERLAWMVDLFGNNRVAEMLGVSRSQPSRWRRGLEGLDDENRRHVADLDYVLSRLLYLYVPDVAVVWLESPHPLLGTRPMDAMRLRGPASVIPAIDLEEEGGYA